MVPQSHYQAINHHYTSYQWIQLIQSQLEFWMKKGYIVYLVHCQLFEDKYVLVLISNIYVCICVCTHLYMYMCLFTCVFRSSAQVLLCVSVCHLCVCVYLHVRGQHTCTIVCTWVSRMTLDVSPCFPPCLRWTLSAVYARQTYLQAQHFSFSMPHVTMGAAVSGVLWCLCLVLCEF